jgi:DNA-binding Lrp family transcriptional regulator
MVLDEIDRRILVSLRKGFPVCRRPYMVAADALSLSESKLISRLQRMLRDRVLVRVGPVYDDGHAGGITTLAALAVPEADYAHVASVVNAQPEIIRNSRRAHRYNMWLVAAADSEQAIEAALGRIESATGLTVLRLPAERAYRVEPEPPV